MRTYLFILFVFSLFFFFFFFFLSFLLLSCEKIWKVQRLAIKETKQDIELSTGHVKFFFIHYFYLPDTTHLTNLARTFVSCDSQCFSFSHLKLSFKIYRLLRKYLMYLMIFLNLKKSNFEIRKNVFFFTSKAFFVQHTSRKKVFGLWHKFNLSGKIWSTSFSWNKLCTVYLCCCIYVYHF